MNICSAIVHTRPDTAGQVRTSLEGFSGVEVHGGVEEGKLVVTLESEGDDGLADTMHRFNEISGVINTVMIYHHSGIETLDQEVVK